MAMIPNGILGISRLTFTYLKDILKAKNIPAGIKENHSEAEEYAVNIIEWFFATNFFAQVEAPSSSPALDLQKQFEKERPQYVL